MVVVGGSFKVFRGVTIVQMRHGVTNNKNKKKMFHNPHSYIEITFIQKGN